jgi:PKD repeat protein
VPAGTGSGSYSFNVKADPQGSGVGEGSGTNVTVNVSAPTPTPTFTPTPTPVPNQPPVVIAPAAQTANEGISQAFDLGSFTDDSSGPWQITVDWGDGNIESFSVSETGSIPSRTHTYADNGNYTVTVTVTDKDGASGSASFQVTVNNVAPVATFTATSPIDEGSSSTLAFTNAFDPSTADTEAGFHYAFACDGNVNSLPTSYAAAGSLASASCLFQDNGSFIVAGRIFDKDNGSSTYSQTVQVNNVPPAIQALSVTPSAINEGDWVTLTGAIVDPGVQDLITVTVSWGDGNSDLVTLGLGRAFTLTHQYLDDNPSGTPWDIYTITVTAVDDDGGSDAASTLVTVNNVPPTVGPLTGAPADPIPVNTRITVTAVFTDPGIRDTHMVTVYWDWDTYNPNVTTSPSSTLTLSTGTRSFTASYVYSQAGVYTIRAVVEDDDGGRGEVIYQYVVVYDPSAGFVTGGGWFWSPKGACQLFWCQDAEGRANFGFVSKYQKGAKVPTGQTEFQFQAGNLNFHSDAYQWLVISGPKAQYKGTGTLNGVSGYGFLLTAWDGQVSGGGGQDKFRIKIWDSYGNVVYDNQMGADDAADPTTVIQGSIVIHTK